MLENGVLLQFQTSMPSTGFVNRNTITSAVSACQSNSSREN
jgi:hypothetical protein